MNRKILLIEDDLYIADLYETAFKKAGCEVTIAKDGEEAVGLQGAALYDLILLDIMLPKLTGLEVLREIKKSGGMNEATPVYLLTNLGEERITKEAYNLGASGYFLKAKYLPKQLVDEVETLFKSGNTNSS
ncbi:response regulator [candidate division WWE3 bacterium]|nr:response regulator [candidate division WWE3 bacterium]